MAAVPTRICKHGKATFEVEMSRTTPRKRGRTDSTSPGSKVLQSGGWLRNVLGICLLCSLFLWAADCLVRWQTVEKINAIRLTDVPPATLSIPPGAWEEHLILPGSSMDARWWVVHTREMVEQGTFRVRDTDRDNAPNGREVHWSSLLMWLLAGIAHALSWASGKPPLELISQAALYAGPVLQAGALLGLSWIIARRFGGLPAIFFAIVFLSSYPVVRTFQAGEADHHGIVLAFAAAGVLSLICGNGGFVSTGRAKGKALGIPDLRTEQARGWFRLAGILGGASIWISAATALPILAAAGIGACLCAWSARMSPPRGKFEPELWFTWAKWGGGASLFFYILEYFPGHLGWRLEVNHPLYALAWLGGGILLREATAVIAGNRPIPRPGALWSLVPAALLVALPLVAIVIWRERVFWVSDRFLLALHDKFIFEFQSLPTLFRRYGNSFGFLTYYPFPLFALATTLVLLGKRALGRWGTRALLVLAPPTLLMQALAIHQVRWSSAAFALWALWALVIFVDAFHAEVSNRARRWVLGAAAVTCWIGLAITQVPQYLATAEASEALVAHPLPAEAGNGIILRDLAHRLIQSSPERVPVVLTGPNSSTDLVYHGGIRTLGTLYWENTPGLKRAAEVFTARDEQDALERLTSAGVTHIVIPSWDNFADAYARLLNPEDPMTAFFRGIVSDSQFPDWLRPFAYPIPTDAGLDATSVKIFAVLPQQNLFESRFFQGVYHFESGEFESARPLFEEAVRLRPEDPRPHAYLSAMESDGKTQSP